MTPTVEDVRAAVIGLELAMRGNGGQSHTSVLCIWIQEASVNVRARVLASTHRPGESRLTDRRIATPRPADVADVAARGLNYSIFGNKNAQYYGVPRRCCSPQAAIALLQTNVLMDAFRMAVPPVARPVC
jgi:hypothetical protein